MEGSAEVKRLIWRMLQESILDGCNLSRMVVVKMERTRPCGFRLGCVLEVKVTVCTDGLYVGKNGRTLQFFYSGNWMDDCVIC